ncbi:DUF2523 domain-containing protein [Xenorhabdus bovienii]|uniref:DUF2523 domain-containing protein n=2 Tax=Xenorhabdus bovienii TaxID=40576 RepID=A0AAJ1MXU6_XENBV|nr:DUF2523 family protein [Xenorhabdus bovienii]MDE1477669.1 DUF2523 domain-containing protein [Xenorhabdus bovienii]MDE1493935.1 DUF2523 domain-containing protein [Xenorhabdus bovienii]MDE9471948.1 DUF2523 domain-containing protein [Xenorhabdus bovienii]MDE9509410.1 DUF2523 domain-containing protein [Xenorhabdus bovienii]MDE9521055.1 DUF2523 domain-containing protein [Xenorhabdus bovienii]
MYGILLSALNAVLGFVLRTVVIKFVVFGALYLVVKELFFAVMDLLPQSSNIQSLFDLLPDAAWYFINLFQGAFGVSLVVTAWFTRFIIRRIPIIG